MVEVAIRENGGQPKWISVSDFKKILRNTKSHSPCPPKLKKVDGFNEWWKLYSYVKNKAKAEISWNKHVKKEFVDVVMKHTKEYVKATPDKKYRRYPSTYLNQHTWNDEITKQDKRIEIEEYKHDTTGMPMGKCEKCGKKDTYLNQWELRKGSTCCSVKVLPFK